jgi:hypothetical protein
VDVSAYNLLDDFRISGHWWLPTKPEHKIPGTLTVNPDAGVRLELVGRFDSPEFDAFGMFSRNVPLEIVLGADADGEVYTLHKLDMLQISNTSTFRVSYLLAGKHFPTLEEIVFSSALIQYTYLEAWSRFNFAQSGKSDSPDFLLIQVPINVETLFRMGGAGEIKELSLDAHALWRQSLSAIDIKPSAHFKIDLNAAADLRTFFQLVNDLGHFMTLLIGEPSYVKKLRLCTSPDVLVDVFYPSTIRREKKLHPAEMCFTLTEVRKIVPMLVEKWFKSLELLAPIYDLLFGTLFDPDSFVRTKFINLTQALESFHRRTEGGTYISSSEFVAVRDVLIAAVPAKMPDSP